MPVPLSLIAATALPGVHAERVAVGSLSDVSVSIVAIAAVAVTAFTLARLTHRRRAARQRLEERLHVQRILSSFSLAMAVVSREGIDAAVDAWLREIGGELGIDVAVWWKPGRPADAAWDSPLLRSNEPLWFDAVARLPPTVQAQVDGRACSALAIPLTAGGVTSGALFWAFPADGGPRVGAEELQTIAGTVAKILRRGDADRALAAHDRLKAAILDALSANVAVLDRDGVIIAVNEAWTAFARENGAAGSIGVGTSYIDICAKAIAGTDDPWAREALAMIEAACQGIATGETIEYRCDAPDRVRWFLLTVEPLRLPGGGAIVTHTDITARKSDAAALAESEARFAAMADALPIAVWMADANAATTYVNIRWLTMTGRTLAEERGAGWLDGVHPDDRNECMDEYLRAFHARRGFSIEYRVRRADGTYCWMMNTGRPRYNSDGLFLGYVGGCLDVTESKEAHLALRDINRRLLAAQEEERRRIARELHDHLSQQLALLAIDLQTVTMAESIDSATARATLDECWRRSTEIASDVHAISHRLHPSKLEALGLLATIQAHCRDMSRQGLAVRCGHEKVPLKVPPDVSLCLFRVAQEALSNVAQHSGADKAYVTLSSRGDDLVLMVFDRGRGFDGQEPRSGLGLISMRERVEALGGTLSISSSSQHGTILTAMVPMHAASDAAGESLPPGRVAGAGRAPAESA